MSDYSLAPRPGSQTTIVFTILEPGGLTLHTLKTNLDDFAKLTSFSTLLNVDEYRYWSRTSQPDLRVDRLRYGSPFEIVGQLPEVANALAPHLVWPSVGFGVILANQVLKQVRGLFRDWTGGWRELSESAKLRAEADLARAQAEESRARSSRERWELEARRQREATEVPEAEALTRLMMPDFLADAAAIADLPQEARDNLLNMLRELDRQDKAALHWNATSVPVTSRPSKERDMVRMFSRLVFKEEAEIRPNGDPRP